MGEGAQSQAAAYAMRERVIRGQPACDGLVVGPLCLERAATAAEPPPGAPEEEAAALRHALTEAGAQLGSLMRLEGGNAADILEFQHALIEDEDLTAPVFAAIAASTRASAAWRTCLDAEIATYRAGEDEYLAARADDLVDLRDRVLRCLYGASGSDSALPAGAIVVAQGMTPSRFLELMRAGVGGIATVEGSRTSHVALLARARGLPLVVGLELDLGGDRTGDPAEAASAVLNATAGTLTLAATAETLCGAKAALDIQAREAAVLAQGLELPAMTARGEPVSVLINVDDPAILDGLSPAICDGIGLTRTEFLFAGGRLPDEDAQTAVYTRIVAWAQGRPVTIRTLDAGGDKPIPGVTPDDEPNPFLGVRGLRLSLQHRDLFAAQLRALCRAAATGPVKAMLPMVTVPDELATVRAALADAAATLRHRSVDHAIPALGMMVEVPAAAMTAEAFDADFYSIGSNDLVQYVTACARDNPSLAPLADPANPAVLELIWRTVDAGRKRGVEVSVCGDMASDPRYVQALLGCGVRVLSAAPAQVAKVKQAVRGYAGSGGAA